MSRSLALALSPPSRRLVVALLTAGLTLAVASTSAFAATFTVDSTLDAVDANPGDGVCATATGSCTVRAAVMEANVVPEANTIHVPAGVYTLTIPGTDEDGAATGDLDLRGHHSTGHDFSLTLEGEGSAVTIIDGGHLDRVLDILAPPIGFLSTNVRDLTIRHGNPGGGAVRDGAGNFERVRVVDNAGYGLLSLRGDNFTQMAILHSTIEENSDRGVRAEGFILVIEDSVIARNLGGGLSASTNPSLQVRRTSIVGNTAWSCAGMFIHYNDSTASSRFEQVVVTDNTATTGDGGGACFSNVGPFRVSGSAFTANKAAGDGGGMTTEGYPATISNTTISGNSAGGSGGGIKGIARMTSVTITDNTADADANGTGDGGGIAAIVHVSDSFHLKRVLLSGNVDTGSENDDCVGPLTSDDHNLIGTISPGCLITPTATDLIGADPKLAPLDLNQGTTPSHALRPGSAALESAGACTGPDQRGVTRPQGAACDIGAYERTPCGNGTVELGEACDDGNVVDGDCCSSTCTFEPNDTPCAADTNACTDDVCDAGACTHPPNTAPCNDGNACTTDDVCGGGSCTAGTPVTCDACESCTANSGCAAAPRTGCHQQTVRLGSPLQLADKTTDRLTWSWSKGDATSLAELGDPLGGDGYALCLFDESGPTPQVAFRAVTRSGQCGQRPCWKKSGTTAFRYKDATLTPDGLDSVLLKSGVAGKAKILVAAKGANLTLPTLPLGLPARMQLQAENGACWEARYFELGAARNDPGQFKGKAFLPLDPP